MDRIFRPLVNKLIKCLYGSFLAEKLTASQECFCWLEAAGYGNLLCYHTGLFCRLSKNHCFKVIFGVGFNTDVFLS